MKVVCLGYYNKQRDDWVDCNFEQTVRSYQELHDNPNWGEFQPAERTTDGNLTIFSQCIVCEELEYESLQINETK